MFISRTKIPSRGENKMKIPSAQLLYSVPHDQQHGYSVFINPNEVKILLGINLTHWSEFLLAINSFFHPRLSDQPLCHSTAIQPVKTVPFSRDVKLKQASSVVLKNPAPLSLKSRRTKELSKQSWCSRGRLIIQTLW